MFNLDSFAQENKNEWHHLNISCGEGSAFWIETPNEKYLGINPVTKVRIESVSSNPEFSFETSGIEVPHPQFETGPGAPVGRYTINIFSTLLKSGEVSCWFTGFAGMKNTILVRTEIMINNGKTSRVFLDYDPKKSVDEMIVVTGDNIKIVGYGDPRPEALRRAVADCKKAIGVKYDENMKLRNECLQKQRDKNIKIVEIELAKERARRIKSIE